MLEMLKFMIFARIFSHIFLKLIRSKWQVVDLRAHDNTLLWLLYGMCRCRHETYFTEHDNLSTWFNDKAEQNNKQIIKALFQHKQSLQQIIFFRRKLLFQPLPVPLIAKLPTCPNRCVSELVTPPYFAAVAAYTAPEFPAFDCHFFWIDVLEVVVCSLYSFDPDETTRVWVKNGEAIVDENAILLLHSR